MEFEAKILKFLEDDGRLTPAQLAVMLGKEEGEVKTLITRYEETGIILGYRAIVDWDKAGKEDVNALIELKMMPQKDRGFDSVAERICKYNEVKSVYLMSGGFDLALFIEGKTMREVAFFVADKLAPLEYVTATATHFMLHKYKSEGVMFCPAAKDSRTNIL